MQDSFFKGEFSINCRGTLVSLATPKVMGILNISQDSFYDGGKFMEPSKMIRRTAKMLEEGAAFIDLGAVSSRPGARPVNEKTERNRLAPAIKALVKAFPKALFSVDTERSEVAALALDEGAAMINDISAGLTDRKMIPVVASRKAPYIAMHRKGTPTTMQKNPRYQNVTSAVFDFLQERLYTARQAGINDVVLDPGFGFGKTTEHNFTLLKNLYLYLMLDAPLLVGISRKSMINKVLGTHPEKALNGTTVLNSIALLNGAVILRVHDVKEAVEAVQLVTMYRQA